jgi:hypothetical protein
MIHSEMSTSSGHTRNSKRMIQCLLGINGANSQPQDTKTLKKVDTLCLILICIGAGYLTTLQGFDSLPMNADSLAPFEEAKSLISNPETHLFNIHVSRIPSIFPDLTLNVLLQLILPKAGFLEIFSWYSWCTSSIFLLLTTILINKINWKEQTLTAASIKASLVTIGLLNISHQFNIAYAHILTPVHHGGNALNTLLLLILALQLLKTPKKSTLTAIVLGMATLATLSNKLSIFTAVLPTGILFLTYTKGQARKKLILRLILSAGAGLIIGRLLNEQCATPKFNLSETFFALKQYFQLSWITSASTLASIGSLLYVIKAKNLPTQISAGLTAVSISSLSYLIYLPALTGSGEAPLRYICVSYSLIIIFIVHYINRINGRRSRSTLLTLIIVTILSFQSPVGPYLNITAHRSLKHELVDRSERIEPFKNDAADFIHTMGYSSYLGIGQYWMTAVTLLSNSKIQLIPMLKTGKPDFWGATPQDIKYLIKPLDKQKTYLISDSDNFKKRIETRYGEPIITWNYDDKKRLLTQKKIQTENRILIFNNPEIYKKVSRRTKNFKRQCNKALPNYNKR